MPRDPDKPHSTRWIISALILLNLLLAYGLFLRLNPRSALAATGTAAPGDFLVVSGRSSNNMMLYSLNTSTGKLGAIKQDAAQNRSTLVGTADVTQDLERAFPQN